MLTGFQTEVVAFYPQDGGEYLCPSCAREHAGTEIAFTRAERGLNDELQPVIRYSLDSSNGERAYEAAEERLRQFVEDHPMFHDALVEDDSEYPQLQYRARWTNGAYRIMDRLAEKFEHDVAERCGWCGEEL